MEMRTLDDVTEFNVRQREALLNEVTRAPADAQRWRPGLEKWSAVEHLEHVALIAANLTDALAQLVAQGRQQGLTAAPDTPRLLDVRPALVAVGAVGKRFQSPLEALPEGRALTEIIDMLARQQARALEVATALPYLDTDRMMWDHPVTGATLNAAQLWNFHGVHELLHLRHVQAIFKEWQQR